MGKVTGFLEIEREQPKRREVREINRRRNAQGYRYDERNDRRHQRPVDKRQGAEARIDRVPEERLVRVRINKSLVEELEPELMPR